MRQTLARIVWMLIVVTGSACSLSQDFDECSTSADCPSGLVCSPEAYCVTQASLVATTFVVDEICVVAVPDNIGDPNGVVLGAVLPLSGAETERGIELGRGMQLALEEINGQVGGIGPRSRPISMVFCDSASEVEQGLVAAGRLVDLGVAAIVGPVVDDVAVAVADNFAAVENTSNPIGLAIVSPGASTPLLDSGDTANRVWATTAPATAAAKGIAAMLADRSSYDLPEEATVLMLSRESEYGAAMAQATVAEAGVASLVGSVTYGSDFGPAWDEIKGIRPGIFVVHGTGEIGQLIVFIESQYQALGEPLPRWILSESGRKPDLFDAFVSESAQSLNPVDVLSRVQGVMVSARGPLFEEFSGRFITRWDGVAPGPWAAAGYDAAYAVAHALGAASAQQDKASFVSADVVDQLPRLLSGELVAVGPADTPRGIQILGSAPSTSIDLVGAGGPLDFDENGRPASSSVDRWLPDWDTAEFSFSPLLDSDGQPASGAQ